MKWFGDELTKRTNGRIKAKYYENGVLGKEMNHFRRRQLDLSKSEVEPNNDSFGVSTLRQECVEL